MVFIRPTLFFILTHSLLAYPAVSAQSMANDAASAKIPEAITVSIPEFYASSPPVPLCRNGLHRALKSLLISYGFSELGESFGDMLGSSGSGTDSCATTNSQSSNVDSSPGEFANQDDRLASEASAVSKPASQHVVMKLPSPLMLRLALFMMPNLASMLNSAFKLLSIPILQTLVYQLFESIEYVNSRLVVKSRPVNLFQASCEALNAEAHTSREPNQMQCRLLDIFSLYLTCSAFEVPMTNQCSKAASPQVYSPYTCSVGEGWISTSDFHDIVFDEALSPSVQRPLVQVIPEKSIKKERLSLFFLYRSTQEIKRIARAYVECQTAFDKPMELVPGWLVDLIVNVQEEGELVGAFPQTDTLPYLFVSRPTPSYENKIRRCRTLVTLRPTITMFEWKLDLSTNMRLIDKAFPGAKGHSGFVRVASAVADPLVSYLHKRLHEEEGCANNMELIMTGHSLGSGVGQALALQIRARFPADKLRISTAFFAAPNSLNKEAAEAYGQSINGRIINFELDPVPYAPCNATITPKGFPRCGGVKRTAVISTGTGFDYYVSAPGRYTLPYVERRAYHNLTQELVTIGTNGLKPASKSVLLDFRTLHTDVYNCWASEGCNAPELWSCTRPIRANSK